MLNIVIPMAGAGSRFKQAGYTVPKPFIQINHVPMIQLVISNLRPRCPHRFIFICQREHVTQYHLAQRLLEWAGQAELVLLDGLTEGAACTVLAAKQWIDNTDSLMIANSDQYVEVCINAYINDMTHRALDGLIMTMKANDPKWSFAAIDDQAYVTRVAEKEVISNDATVGIYNFARGCDFVQMANDMIAANERVNGEFYVAPVYNRLIAAGRRIGIFNVGSEGQGMYGLGTPTDLTAFLNTPIAHAATQEMR